MFLKESGYDKNPGIVAEKKNVMAEAAKFDNEPRSIVIILDESTSMKGDRWTNALKGISKLVNEVKDRYKSSGTDSSKMNLLLIFFATYPRVVYDGCIDDVPEFNCPKTWKMLGGFTFYGRALKEAYKQLKAQRLRQY